VTKKKKIEQIYFFKGKKLGKKNRKTLKQLETFFKHLKIGKK
jgi:hypothetical protein